MTRHHPEYTETTPLTPRQAILGRLKTAARIPQPDYPQLPSSPFLSMNHEEQLEALERNLKEQGTEVHRTKGLENLRAALFQVMAEENLSRVMVNDDPFMESVLGVSHGKNPGPVVVKPSDVNGNGAYKDAVFSVDAGLTSVYTAVAESGTLIIAHDPCNPRLISLAPLVHLAVVRTDTVVPVYEKAVERVLQNGGLPSQLTFITGPSLTADIMATPFRGMHGPRRLIVFLADM